jgi:hypothetical protein
MGGHVGHVAVEAHLLGLELGYDGGRSVDHARDTAVLMLERGDALAIAEEPALCCRR